MPEPLSSDAERLLNGGDALFAPDFLLIEFGNVTCKKVGAGELARADGDAALAALRSGPVRFMETTPLVERTLHLAHELDHPLYDCLYLATAEAVAATVATADRRFFDQCSAALVGSHIAWLGRLASGALDRAMRQRLACSSRLKRRLFQNPTECLRWTPR